MIGITGMSKKTAAVNNRKISTAFYNWRLIRYAPWPLLLLVTSDLLFYGSRVAPGLIDTPVHAKFSTEVAAMFQRVLPRIPLGRVGTPADVAGWIVFLASEQAAFVTGQVIEVDGGQLMA